MTKTKIPHDLGAHHEYTALFAMSHHSSKVYTLEGDTVEQHEDLVCPELDCEFQDNEGFSMTADGHGFNSAKDKHYKEHDEHVFLNHLVEYIRKMETHRPIKHIIFYSPKDLSGLTEHKLPHDIMAKSVIHPINLWHAHATEIIERMKG